jgi:hypothetical protein
MNEESEQLCFGGSLARYRYGLVKNHKYMTAAILPRFKGNDEVKFSILVGWDSKEYKYDY